MNKRLPIKLFVEGINEINYFSALRTKENITITYKEANMKGGGYSSFLDTIRKSSDLGYIAIFILIDLDKYIDEPNERKNFDKLLNFCKSKNKGKGIPYFLIGTNNAFEYFACCHCPEYKNQKPKTYITKKFGYDSLSDFKADAKIYEFLNRDKRSLNTAITSITQKPPFIRNEFTLIHKGLDITFKNKKALINYEALNYYHTNIYELLNLIGLE